MNVFDKPDADELIRMLRRDKQVKDLYLFQTFLCLCVGRVGECSMPPSCPTK